MVYLRYQQSLDQVNYIMLLLAKNIYLIGVNQCQSTDLTKTNKNQTSFSGWSASISASLLSCGGCCVTVCCESIHCLRCGRILEFYLWLGGADGTSGC